METAATAATLTSSLSSVPSSSVGFLNLGRGMFSSDNINTNSNNSNTSTGNSNSRNTNFLSTATGGGPIGGITGGFLGGFMTRTSATTTTSTSAPTVSSASALGTANGFGNLNVNLLGLGGETLSSATQNLYTNSTFHIHSSGGGSIMDPTGVGTGTGTSHTTSGTSFDLSDFPSLGGTSAAAVSSSSALSAAAAGSGNGLAAALRQQQILQQQQQQQHHLASMLSESQKSVAQQQQQQQQQSSNLYRLAMTGSNSNFNMAVEDFPALSSSGAPQTSRGTNAAPNASNTNGTSSLSAASLLSGSGGASLLRVGTAVSSANGPISGGLYGGIASSGSDMDAVTNSNSLDASGAGGMLSGSSNLGGLGVLRGLQPQQQQLQLQQAGNAAGNPSSLSRVSVGAPSVTGAIGSSNTAATAAISNAGVVSTSSSAATTGSALSGDYGLLGLLGVIRMTDADRNSLALGSDLTMLGLNLGSSEQIYSTFSSPWSDSNAATKEPLYQLPMCYYMQPPALKTGHLSKFQLETLFYIFYALPKDVLQAYAAQELYSREWRYHGDLKLWFKRSSPVEGGATTASASSTQFIYFDINSWERRLFSGNNSSFQNITSGFLQDEEVRVKFPSS